ncbi:nucleotidyltransferase family protein [Primorskyibacter marinus]|uniref:nucleotidyltransferase family protein n=1 Tax=Primorskyibacter marinus TaxID=1977320 RepID=UPI000E301360|nr:nucleotidyltransferase domain-containing protein [Primorskyibacter marinus]
MDHAKAIDRIVDAIKDAPGIRALFLSGSYATGMADAYSDLDFVLVADEGATDAVASVWRDAIEKTGNIVLWWDRMTVPVLINAITEDWTRTDVIILKPDQMRAHTQSNLKPLFDPGQLYDGLPETAANTGPDPRKVRYQIEEFIRILGLLHLAEGRREYINGVLGIFHLRNLLVDLLIAETNAPHRGGVLHLNRLITDEQKALLTSLPPAIPNREAMIAGHLAYAKAYLPRARRWARHLGVEWPEQFEAATWAKLNETLSIKCPYDPE